MDTIESNLDPNIPDDPDNNELISNNASNIISISSDTDLSHQDNTSNSTINLISSESSNANTTSSDKNAACTEIHCNESCSGPITESSIDDACKIDDEEQHRNIQLDSQTDTNVPIDDKSSTDENTEEPCRKKIRLCDDEPVNYESEPVNIEHFKSSDDVQYISTSSDVKSTEVLQDSSKQCPIKPESDVHHEIEQPDSVVLHEGECSSATADGSHVSSSERSPPTADGNHVSSSERSPATAFESHVSSSERSPPTADGNHVSSSERSPATADGSHVSSIGSSVHEGEEVQQTVQQSVWDNDFSRSPRYLCEAITDFKSNGENFLKGCKWSPDGTCFMTSSDDNYLRLFNLPQPLCELQLNDLPEMNCALKIPEAELIYDYCWHPRMNPADLTTCRLFSTSRDAPVHMWDAFTGELVSTYKAHNHVDELSAAHSIALSPDGGKLYCGFNKMIKVFNIDRPGRQCEHRPTLVSASMNKKGRHKKKEPDSAKIGQSGIISCIDVNPAQPTMYAAGSYTRSIGLYCEPEGTMYCMFQGQSGGVTHLRFSPDGNKLYSGGRKDPEIICWDVRNPGKILYIMNRQLTTNQRIYFDIDQSGQYVISGCQDGRVFIWDTLTPPSEDEDGEPVITPCMTFKGHNDCVNGVSLHPSMPVVATASGQRHFNIPSNTLESDSEEEDNEHYNLNRDSTVKLWWVGRDMVS